MDQPQFGSFGNVKDLCPDKQRFSSLQSGPVTSTSQQSHLAAKQRKAACHQFDKEEVDQIVLKVMDHHRRPPDLSPSDYHHLQSLEHILIKKDFRGTNSLHRRLKTFSQSNPWNPNKQLAASKGNAVATRSSNARQYHCQCAAKNNPTIFLPETIQGPHNKNH
ncbi:hypothetical protein KIN20_013715 [Parelaphostrongylus tenuis]|uniref:Uncharacterized protein n=1 Tax=Parelaphostrongylus tenuis TaxID=148309 RepID=A0AAD5N2D7_PARTN|nr:hypothetical protein KIN20_013715 [Parelaphostrongylus tenuis]